MNSIANTPRIKTGRFIEIASLARELWESFAASEGAKFHPQSLFKADYRTTVNSMAFVFGRHCAEKVIGRTSSEPFMLRQTLDGERKAPSWLWKHPDGSPAVLVDVDQVALAFPGNEREQKKILTRLFLHEIGHVVLHLAELNVIPTGAADEGVYHPGVKDEQEEEAWIFCGVILGLALGCLARDGRNAGLIDCAWEQSC